jgi:hypothetical protein
MIYNDLLFFIGLVCFGLLMWNLWISIQIVKYLNDHNIKAKIAHQRGRIFKFLPIYKKTTYESTGKVGPYYNLFFISFFLFSICLIIGIAFAALQ